MRPSRPPRALPSPVLRHVEDSHLPSPHGDVGGPEPTPLLWITLHLQPCREEMHQNLCHRRTWPLLSTLLLKPMATATLAAVKETWTAHAVAKVKMTLVAAEETWRAPGATKAILTSASAEEILTLAVAVEIWVATVTKPPVMPLLALPPGQPPWKCHSWPPSPQPIGRGYPSPC